MSEETTAFANAMVFDGTSDELREGCVRVTADVIVEVGEGPKAGDRVIDCRGRTVIPVREQIRRSRDEFAISPDAVARAIAFTVEKPYDVEIGDITIRPAVQG